MRIYFTGGVYLCCTRASAVWLYQGNSERGVVVAAAAVRAVHRSRSERVACLLLLFRYLSRVLGA